jgi:hypothetical protein
MCGLAGAQGSARVHVNGQDVYTCMHAVARFYVPLFTWTWRSAACTTPLSPSSCLFTTLCKQVMMYNKYSTVQ